MTTARPTVEIPESAVITVERQDHVTVVWLDRPDKLNAMGFELWDDLPAIVTALGEDGETRVIVIAAKGTAFTVGLDLAVFGPEIMGGQLGSDGSESPVAKRMATYKQVKRMQHTFTAVADCPKPVIAAIHGYCIGGGVDLITACDIRLAATGSVFSVRETKIAMVADVGTLQRLPRIVDPGRVAELVFTGKDIGADEAHEMGLISRVYPDQDALMKGALEMAEQIAANSPLAVQGSKSVMRAAEGRSVEDQLDYVALWNAAFLQSNDLSEAMGAYLEKRPPEFTGE